MQLDEYYPDKKGASVRTWMRTMLKRCVVCLIACVCLSVACLSVFTMLLMYHRAEEHRKIMKKHKHDHAEAMIKHSHHQHSTDAGVPMR